MTRHNSERPKRRDIIIHLLLGMALLLVCVAAGSYIMQRYDRIVLPRQDGKQESYEQLPQLLTHDAHPLLYWAELGTDNSLVKTRFARDEGFSLELTGFRIGPRWQRTVGWHVDGDDKGTVLLNFPPHRVTHVALYMTDGDSYWRSSRLHSLRQHRLATELHDGRWIVLEVEPEEAERGRKSIELYRLTGSSIAISAVGAFGHPGR